MTMGRKRWWRAVAIAAVGGGVIGGWFGLVRPQSAKSEPGHAEETAWTRAPVTTPAAPTVAEVVRGPEVAPPTGPVTPAGAVLLVPVPGAGGPVVPAIPVPPPGLPDIQPVAGPRVPDAGLTGGDKAALPAVPVVPALPPAELPPLPVPPKTPDVKPVAPAADVTPKAPAPVGVPPMPAMPAVPPPMMTAEPPTAPFAPPMPVVPPVEFGAKPATPVIPQPAGIAPSPSPVKPVDPMQPAVPAKPDSDLKPSDPANTLNPTVPPVSPVAPAVPITPPAFSGREAPGTAVDRAKSSDPNFGSSDKFVFPVPAKPAPDPTPAPRDDTMVKLTTATAFAVLGGALLAAEKAAALPVPSPAPGMLVKADDKDVEKLKTDLAAANKKIDDLEKQVKRLTELLTGRKDDLGLAVPTDPGAVEDVKRLKDKIAGLETEIKTLKNQTTALRPTVGAPGVPEVKPKGIVKIINEYPVEISMVINGAAPSYRVAPNTTLEVEVPAGDFTYQLLQSGAPATKSVIKDKEVVKLRIK
jgi:hypothetical protein